MAGVSEITYKDKKILFIDNTGLQEDDVLNNTKEGTKKMVALNRNDILLLIDMSGVFATAEVDARMREIGKEASTYINKLAVVGMAKGVKKILITSFAKLTGVNMKLFEQVEEAKQWLAID